MSRATSSTLPLPLRPMRSVLLGTGRIPAPVFDAVSRWCPVNADGEHVSPELAAIGVVTRLLPAVGLGDDDVDQSRAGMEIGAALTTEKPVALAVEEDLEFDGPGGPVPATRYRFGVDTTGVILFFHGGGFTLGSRSSHDGMARRLAVDTGADVVSVQYRLAPENPFPAALDDALAAWRGVVAAAPGWGVGSDRLVVAGDSAGGNLAAVLAQQVRGQPVTPALQVLIYPMTDMSREHPSMHEFAIGYLLTRERIESFNDSYVPNLGQRADPRVSPLRAEDFSGLPPAIVVVAGFDPLRDEGIAYADALTAAGVPVTLQRAGSLIHGFANLTGISPISSQAVSRYTAAIAVALSAQPG
ncbi:alpha/beta hydrolase [Gordonia sp. NPDC003429]